jgi:hypothetical protein
MLLGRNAPLNDETLLKGPPATAQQEPGELAELAQPATVREAPTVSSRIVADFPSGARLKVVERKPGWVHIVERATGLNGWINQSSAAAAQPAEQPLTEQRHAD